MFERAQARPRLERLDSLPERLRAVARITLRTDPQGQWLADWDDWEAQLTPAFTHLPATDRRELFEHLFPDLGQVIEQGWQLHARLPYQSPLNARPFRAPQSEEELLGCRLGWLMRLLAIVKLSDRTVEQVIKRAPKLDRWEADCIGILTAAAIDAGGPEGERVFGILADAARGGAETMGRHVIGGLLCATRPDGWEAIEHLLLAAQREEGLRQSILETVQDAHPEAFRRVLRLIVRHDLARFSSVVRAVDMWLGFLWEAASKGIVHRTVEQLSRYLEDSAAGASAVGGDDAEQAYLGLWAMAFENAFAAVEPATALLTDRRVEHRFVATHLLAQLDLPAARAALPPMLEDPDLRIPARLLLGWDALNTFSDFGDTELFERLERLLPRFPERLTTLDPIVWPWTKYTIDRRPAARALIESLGTRPASRLIPHLALLGRTHRYVAVNRLWLQEEWDAATRETLLTLVGDPSPLVREQAVEGLARRGIAPAEAQRFESLLTRKAGDLRSGVIRLLKTLPDADALASADRLLAAGSAAQREAGLELLRELIKAKRSAAEARARVQRYAAERPAVTEAERPQLDAVLRPGAAEPTLVDALGLLRPEQRTPPEAPVSRGVQLRSPVSSRLAQALDDFIRANADRIVTGQRRDDRTSTGMLAEWTLGWPDGRRSPPDDRERLMLAELWEGWWDARGPELRDPDGMELPRTLAWFLGLERFGLGSIHGERLRRERHALLKAMFGDTGRGRHQSELNIGSLLRWFVRLRPPRGAVDFVLDAIETSLVLIPQELLTRPSGERPGENEWRWSSPFTGWLEVAEALTDYAPQLWSSAQHARRWRLLRWVDEPHRPGGSPLPNGREPLERLRPRLVDLCLARAAGAATEADLLDHLLGPRAYIGWRMQGGFSDLAELTRRRTPPAMAQFAFLRPLVERCRDRVIEVELARGDTPTAASPAALALRSVRGVDTLFRVLRALGTRQFRRGWHQGGDIAESVFSHLVRSSFPREGERSPDFAAQVQSAKIPDDRLVELAVYAPQWAPFVEHALGWKGLAEAVWWIHGHAKGGDWRVDREIREIWKGDLSTRTALTSDDLLDGAVDVAWFHRAYDALRAARWEPLYEAAKYASSGAGHIRARLFADAMLGKITRKDLVTRIREKRPQDAVRALGLLPLAAGTKRDADVLDRYHTIQEFIRGSRQFGSQRQASEKRAAHIGLDNLARTAGYADPIRLQWAMEAKAIADLAEGPSTVRTAGVTVSLGVNPWGDVELVATRGDKTLADVPAKLKQHPQIKKLRERKVDVKRQASRIRSSLEVLMVRGDTFRGAELQELLKHPLLGPMLRGLVLVGDGVFGYPVRDGKALEDHAGKVQALGKRDELRIAHPLDLLPASQWHGWQNDCFARERIQAFKQVFRELYRLTDTEKQEGTRTLRYAGHQVEPRQALALLGQRGWVHHPEEGVRKTFHDAGLVAWLGFEEGFYTPAEVEGLTLESVHFARRGDGETMRLIDVPARLFSESMRDLDLVVSVAHRGGVDPEATASTVEMRAALVEQTCALLKLRNVTLKDRYAVIDGRLGRYAVHLGSALVHRVPGDVLIIVAVHSQHRGRPFLPFADDDPRTAEVVSKVLLLARDHEIRDPNILDQIREP